MKSQTKIFILILLCLSTLTACKKDKPNDDTFDPNTYQTNQAYTITDLAYGTHNDQKVDIYLPANRNKNSTKTFVLIHGGGWNGGDKSNFTSVFNTLKMAYPNHAIININYQLATWNSPALPKQITDIELALNYFTADKYNISKQFMLVGNSAGGHLSTLYAYKYDNNKYVKGVINAVGPVDLTDSNYVNAQTTAFYDVVGPTPYNSNPQLYANASPVKFITTQSPPTISFYGDTDPLIPNTQMTLLHDELNAKGVYNQATRYVGEGHGNWSTQNSQDYANKCFAFINTYFN